MSRFASSSAYQDRVRALARDLVDRIRADESLREVATAALVDPDDDRGRQLTCSATELRELLYLTIVAHSPSVPGPYDLADVLAISVLDAFGES